MPIVSGKLARTGKVLLCINHKLMCLLLIVLGKSALRWLTISLQHHAVIYLVRKVYIVYFFHTIDTEDKSSKFINRKDVDCRVPREMKQIQLLKHHEFRGKFK